MALLAIVGVLSMGLAQGWLAGLAHQVALVLFVLVAAIRLMACCIPMDRHVRLANVRSEDLPAYTIILALFKEADMVEQLLNHIDRLDYPRDRLQIIAALERDDPNTIAACKRLGKALDLQLSYGIGRLPRTKPRALNAALRRATGEFVVVYDAEDAPHPLQLREAAGVFARSPASLAVVQSPLTAIPDPVNGREIGWQFALDYAVHFHVVQPFLSMLGMPMPLGGTSNHIRRTALDAVGGWDPWNVTEDADLAFRLVRAGFGVKMSRLATREVAPAALPSWVRQRSRWIKGHMQTFGVHSRDLAGLGLQGCVSLLLNIAIGIVSAALHAPFAGLVILTLAAQILGFKGFGLSAVDAAVLAMGWCSSVFAMVIGARRAGIALPVRSLALAPVFWSLQCVAFLRAAHQLSVAPFVWDKTEHAPAPKAVLSQTDCYGSALDGVQANGLSGGRVQILTRNRLRRHDASHPSLGGLRPARQRRRPQAGALRPHHRRTS